MRIALLALALLACDDDPAGEAPVDAEVAQDGGGDATAPDARPEADGAPDEGVEADAGEPPAEEVGRVESGETTLVAFADASFEVRWRDEPRFRFEGDALQLGVVDALDEAFNYDPWYVFIGPIDSIPRGLQWQELTGGSFSQEEATIRWTLRYRAGDATLTLRLEDGRVVAELAPPDGEVAYFRLRPTVGAAEEFYGLGSALDTPNHRGKQVALQIEFDIESESRTNEANVPVPLIIGTRGWGLFVESDHPMALDVAQTDPERVDFLVGAGLDSADGLRFHLFAEAHPLDVTRRYYEVTGTPELPAPWALGPWLWRDENEDQAEVERDAETMRELDLATSAIWVDRPYASGVSSFDFHPEQFPDPQGMIDRLHALGYRFALWHTAYVGEGQEATAALHAEAEENGYYPPRSGPILADWGRIVDLTNPEAWAWWQALVRRYTEMGVEGFKLDYVQEIVVGIGPVRNEWRFADGTTERTQHKRFQELYHRVFRETLPEDGGFLLTRTGVYGDQRNGVIIWPGDLDANMAKHKERITDRHGDTYNAVGGMPASMVDGLSLGPSGFPFYGADTGGYRHCRPDKETFTRWFEQTALSSVMQVGTSCNDVAWEFREDNGFDREMLDWYRIYTRLHLRLWAYAWTLAHRMVEDGRPLQRPYGLQHPELGVHPWDTYFFGDALLVAPVVEHGARSRVVPFPPGPWYDWWTGERIEGGVDLEVDAPLGKLPLYQRAGSVVPMLRPTIDTLSPVDDSYAADPGRLYARVAAGPAEAFTLFDGSRIAHDGAGTFSVAAGEAFVAGFQIEVMGLESPAVAELPEVEDAEALEAAERGWYVDDQGWLHVRLAPGDEGFALRE